MAEAAIETVIVPDYKAMQDGDFLSAIGVDAVKWTDAFLQIAPAADDKGTMIGWFANAIMAGLDEGRRRERLDRAEYDQALGSAKVPIPA